MAVSRVTTVGVEVLRDGAAPNARVTSLGAEVLRNAAAPNARVTSLGVEVLHLGVSTMRMTSLGIEVLRSVADVPTGHARQPVIVFMQ